MNGSPFALSLTLRSIWLLSQKQKRGPNPRVAVAVTELWRGKQKGQSVAVGPLSTHASATYDAMTPRHAFKIVQVDSSANQRYGHLTSCLKTSTRSARAIKRVSHVHNPIGLKLTTHPLTSTHPSPPSQNQSPAWGLLLP